MNYFDFFAILEIMVEGNNSHFSSRLSSGLFLQLRRSFISDMTGSYKRFTHEL